ncbi:hypothetical protein AVEN_4532-1 [Araneus ventricosus]|uniref:Uncharacterized protein n=1 Tax=Araneus ventricosus TaxID=182803 RepID=A0A4Y2BNQ6_ARAVE|nr:hypothetical protein AVEN_4532-1 [Araneus ventricosus]
MQEKREVGELSKPRGIRTDNSACPPSLVPFFTRSPRKSGGGSSVCVPPCPELFPAPCIQSISRHTSLLLIEKGKAGKAWRNLVWDGDAHSADAEDASVITCFGISISYASFGE